ncbi:SLC13 family permease [Paenibacillus sp. 1P07SE]|uniref:SLC13 family permease n=1 Tax=Paenibacillus sp. 1P07SE TaxID=3132209 RepID=UPI0039A766CE
MNASRVKMFAGLSNMEQARVLGRLDKMEVRAETVLFRQGDPGEEMYILHAGAIELSAATEGGEQRPLARLTAGETLGEMALLTGERRSATAVTATDAILYRIDRPTFDALILEQTSIATYFLRQLSQRLNQSNMQLQASKEEQAQRAHQELQQQSPAIRALLLKLAVYPVIETTLPQRLCEAAADATPGSAQAETGGRTQAPGRTAVAADASTGSSAEAHAGTGGNETGRIGVSIGVSDEGGATDESIAAQARGLSSRGAPEAANQAPDRAGAAASAPASASADGVSSGGAAGRLGNGEDASLPAELEPLRRYLLPLPGRPGWHRLEPGLRRMLSELHRSERGPAERQQLLAREAEHLAAQGHLDEAVQCWLELEAWPQAAALLVRELRAGRSLPDGTLARLDASPAQELAASYALLEAYAQQGIAQSRQPALAQLEAVIALEPAPWRPEQTARVYEWAAELSHRLERHAKAMEYVQMAEELGRRQPGAAGGGSAEELEERSYRLKRQQVQRQRTERLASRAGALLGQTRWSAAASILAALLVIVLFAWLPPLGGLSAQAMLFVGISIAAVILWIVNIIPDYLVALLMAMLWVLGGVVAPETALSGFATPTWLYMVFILALGAAITRSGILYRLSLHALKRFPSHYRGQLWGIVAGGALLNPLIPSSSAKVALGVPVAATLSESMGFRDRSRGAAGLSLAAMVFYGFTAPFVLTGSYTNVMAYGLAGGSAPVSWFQWFLYALPAFALFSIGMLLLLTLLFRGVRAEKPISRQMLDEQLAILGVFSRQERITTAAVIGCIVLMIAQPLHGVDNAWVMLLGFGVLIVTGVLDGPSLRSGVDWPFLIFIGIAFSFAEAASALGIIEAMTGFLGQHMAVFLDSPLLFLPAVVLLSFLVTLIIRDDPAVILLVIALLPLAELAGVHPWVLVFLVLLSTDPFFFAYQSPTYLMAYYSTEGRAFSHRQGQWMGLGYGVLVLLIAVACIPYWQWLGLLR